MVCHRYQTATRSTHLRLLRPLVHRHRGRRHRAIEEPPPWSSRDPARGPARAAPLSPSRCWKAAVMETSRSLHRCRPVIPSTGLLAPPLSSASRCWKAAVMETSRRLYRGHPVIPSVGLPAPPLSSASKVLEGGNGCVRPATRHHGGPSLCPSFCHPSLGAAAANPSAAFKGQPAAGSCVPYFDLQP